MDSGLGLTNLFRKVRQCEAIRTAFSQENENVERAYRVCRGIGYQCVSPSF
jgi:hypothetical protein